VTANAADPPAPTRGVVKTGAMATLILAWEGVGDMAVSFVLLASTIVVNPVVVGGVAFAILTAVTLAFCSWIDGNWDGWYAKAGPKVADRIEKWRRGGRMSRVVGWITDGSSVTYGVAAALLSPVIVVTTARAVTGRAVGRARVVWACLAYSIVTSAVIGLIGLAIHEGARAG
jgi:hypothetical protein